MRRDVLTSLAIALSLAACSGSEDEATPRQQSPVSTPIGASGTLGFPTSPMQPTTMGSAGSPAGVAGNPVVPMQPMQQPPARPPARPPATPPANPPAVPPANPPAVPPANPPGPPPTTSGAEPAIPMAPAMCPEIKTGDIQVLGQSVTLWVGQKQEGKKGPVVFYWHGTGSSPIEATSGLGPGNAEVMAEGGVIASFSTTTGKGTNTGNNVWYTGDFEMADQILACAVQQLNIDTRRIYTAGCSAGGLQASAMVYGRSSYLAAAMPNSGGTVRPYQFQSPGNVPGLITTHGAMGKDVVVIDFAQTSNTQVKDIAAKGGLAIDCDHGGAHCRSPANVKAAQWQFLKDNPFGVTPKPYADGLPASFPEFCKKF